MKNLFFLGLLLIGSSLFSQEPFNAEGELKKMNPTPNSPEAAAFGSYGSIPINLRTGKPNISVPLYTYKGQEMDLSMSLSYDIDARKVEDISSGVGMGWNLALGGRITRNINGLADTHTKVIDAVANYETLITSNTLRGKYNRFIDKNIDVPAQSTQNTFADHAEVDEYFQFLDRLQTNAYDVALDSYNISAPGLSDQIIMYLDDTDPNNLAVKAVAMNDHNLKIEYNLSGNQTNTYISSWKFTNGSGVQYFFDLAELTETSNELDVNSGPSQIPSGPQELDYNSAWVLTKILSANGKDKYDFTYEEFPIWTQEINSWVSQSIDYQVNVAQNIWGGREINASSKYKIAQKAVEQVRHNDELIINITLGQRDDLELDSKIEKIVVSSPIDGSIMNTFKFYQSNFGINNGIDEKDLRLKLDSIQLGGKGSSSPNYDYEKRYRFTYHDSDNMPPRDSKAQDVFGFYNGYDTNSDLFPTALAGQAGPNSGGGIRDFRLNYAKIGILTQMDYPTGGFSIFYYDEHISGEIEANGLKITSIENYSDVDEIATKVTYDYQDIDTDDFALPKLRYFKNVGVINASGTLDTRTEYYRTAKGITGDQPYITYGKVIERTVNPFNNNANGVTEHIFYNEDSTSNPLGIRPWQVPPFPLEYFSSASKGQSKETRVLDASDILLSHSENILNGSGFIDTETFYGLTVLDASERSVQFPMKIDLGAGNGIQVIYVDGDPTSQGLIVPSYCNQGNNVGCLNINRYARIQPKKLFNERENRKQAEAISRQYLEGNEVTTTSSSLYDASLNYLMSESSSSTSEDGKTIVKKYKYPQEFYSQGDNAIDALVDANRIATPVEVTTYERIDNNGNPTDELLSTQKTQYDTFGQSNGVDHIFPDAVLASRRGDLPEPRVEFDSYDDNGNPVQVRKTNGPSSSHLWGYDGLYPVAKIENASYSQVTGVSGLNINTINNPPPNGANIPFDQIDLALRDEIDKIRQALPKAMVSTYTYTPFLAISTITDSRGYVSYFHYDDENRLKYVTDEDGNVLSQNEYNYKLNN